MREGPKLVLPLILFKFELIKVDDSLSIILFFIISSLFFFLRALFLQPTFIGPFIFRFFGIDMCCRKFDIEGIQVGSDGWLMQ